MLDTSLSLLARAQADASDEAWVRLTAVYSPLLRSWLLRFGVAPFDADDLTQDVLLTVARELPRFDHSGRAGAFRSWLRAIVAHRVRDFWRSRKARPPATGGSQWIEQLQQLEDESSSLSREWDLDHDRQVMSRLLEQVRPRVEPKTWLAFHRQMFDGQRADAVAEELGIPLNSVYVARSRVLAMLRREAVGLLDE